MENDEEPQSQPPPSVEGDSSLTVGIQRSESAAEALSLPTSPLLCATEPEQGVASPPMQDIGEASLAMALSLAFGASTPVGEILPRKEGDPELPPIPFGIVPKINLFGLSESKKVLKFEEKLQTEGLIPKITIRFQSSSGSTTPPSKLKDRLAGRQRSITVTNLATSTSNPQKSFSSPRNLSSILVSPTEYENYGEKPVAIEGWLLKQSDDGVLKKLTKSWDRIYFVLNKSSMSLGCFRAQPAPAERPQKMYNLTGRSVVTAEALSGKRNSFGLFHPNESPMFFAANTEEEMVMWIQALEIHSLGLKSLLDAKLEDFETICTIGKGAYGRVYQVRHKESRQIFAMKVVKKREVVQREAVEAIKNERRVMALVSHPFIIKMRYSFMSEQHLCFVMDLALGGELFQLLRDRGPMATKTVSFYVSEVVLAVDYLHSCGIVYRDLKPENILLSESGHVKLTDFGFSRLVGRSTRLYSVCGTPVYMAPEVIKEEGYGRGADWWSVGILTYELLVGRPPFYHENVRTCYEFLTTKPFEFPPQIPVSATGFVRGLCTPEARFRLGCGAGGSAEIKSHSFFTGVNWKDVFDMKIIPPYVPDVKGRDDVSAFDDEFLAMKNGNRLSVDSNATPQRSDSVFGNFEFNAMMYQGLTSEERRVAMFGKEIDVDVTPPSEIIEEQRQIRRSATFHTTSKEYEAAVSAGLTPRPGGRKEDTPIEASAENIDRTLTKKKSVLEIYAEVSTEAPSENSDLVTEKKQVVADPPMQTPTSPVPARKPNIFELYAESAAEKPAAPDPTKN